MQFARFAPVGRTRCVGRLVVLQADDELTHEKAEWLSANELVDEKNEARR